MVQPLQGNEVALGGIEIFFLEEREREFFSDYLFWLSTLVNPSFRICLPHRLSNAVSFETKRLILKGRKHVHKNKNTQRGDKHCEAMLFK